MEINVRAISKFCKYLGVKSILQTKPVNFHGINPTLTYKASGKTFNLPRFCSVEMKEARKMNQLADKSAKDISILNFSRATSQDFKRLTSTSIEDSYKRVQWVNPKNGKVYWILKQGESGNGNVLVRILDEKGGFIKNAELKPKTILIADKFDSTHFDIPHGIMVEAFAKRNNPFAKYNIIELKNSGYSVDVKEIADKLEDSLKKDIPDYLSLSIADAKILLQKASFQTISSETKKIIDKYMEGTSHLRKILNKFHRSKTRVLSGAGNNGKMGINMFLGEQTEGVGSLNSLGKVSQFSASRNSGLTQHYELGEYTVKSIKENGEIIGYNFTGKPGCDITSKDLIGLTNKNKKMFLAKTDEIKSKINDINIKIQDLKKKENEINKVIHTEISKLPFDNFLINCDKIRGKYAEQLNAINAQSFTLSCSLNPLNLELGEMEKNLQKEVSFTPTIWGTSFSTPIRTAKLALNEMMDGIL